MKNYPSGEAVAIRETFKNGGNLEFLNGMSSHRIINFNEDLPPQPRGIFIGGVSGTTYRVYFENTTGDIVPYCNMAPGVVHPVFPFRRIIHQSGVYETDAVNMLVLY